MWMLRRVDRQADIAVFAAVAFFFVPSQARGGCSPQDFINAVEGTYNTFTSSGCAGVEADPALWTPVGVASGIMAGVSQSQQFCQGVQNVANQLNNVQGDGNSLVTALDNQGVNADFLASALGALGSATDALAVVQCSCALSNNITAIGTDLGDCIQDALCDLQDLAHDIDPAGFPSCSGGKVVVLPTNCTQNPWQSNGAYDQSLGNVVTQCPAGDDAPPVTQVNGPDGGSLVIDPVGGGVYQCMCPPPMIGTWNSFNHPGWWNVIEDPNCQFFLCTCPPHSKPAATSGPGSFVCICDNTHQPAQPPIKTTNNPGGIPCPLPLTGQPCPAGETNAGGGVCVPTCAADQILLASGTCCNPEQASACGACCSNGEMPDPATGNCVAHPKPPRPGPPNRHP